MTQALAVLNLPARRVEPTTPKSSVLSDPFDRPRQDAGAVQLGGKEFMHTSMVFGGGCVGNEMH